MSQSAPKWLRPLLAMLGMAVLVSGAAYWMRGLMEKEPEAPRRVVQEVRIVRPPPPPEEEPPPPPPPVEEEVDLPEPDMQPEVVDNSSEPPPGDQLGIDAEGTGAGDGFGLVGRPGGRDLLASGGSGSAFAWYGGVVQNEILDRLGDDPQVRTGSYSVAVRVWIASDGRVERASLVGSSGDAGRDAAIERALTQITRLSQPPPANMPQPINLRIVSRV